MHLKQCFARAKPFWLKKRPDFDWYFDFKKKPSASKKAWISKFGFKNAKLATLHMTSDYMRPPLLGEVAVASQGQVFDHRNWARKFIQPVLWFSCNSWRIWFYLTCSWLISREHVRFPRKLLPGFHTFCSPVNGITLSAWLHCLAWITLFGMILCSLI